MVCHILFLVTFAILEDIRTFSCKKCDLEYRNKNKALQ